MEIKTVQLVIRGTVQGVFYRATAKEMAEKIGIHGWVKNTPEGNVEILCQGTDRQVKDFISWCWKGPSRAKVEAVDILETTEGPLKGFTVIRGK